jgi:outer membrane protein assembly factor BamB
VPAERPGLAPDAELERTIRLGAGTAPLHRIRGPNSCRRIYLLASTELRTFSLKNGQEARYQAIAPFTHVAETAKGFVAANQNTVALYGASREPLWVFRVPTTDLLPTQPGDYRIDSDNNPSQPELSDFRLCGCSLVARLGERHLIAFDLENHRVSWVLGTDGNLGFSPTGFPDSPRFGAAFLLSGRFIVAQISSGNRLLIRTDTGKVLEVPALGNQTAALLWASPPAQIETNQLAVADGPALIRKLSLQTGRVRWTYSEENRSSSLTGEPPQIRAWDEVLVIAVRRNFGVELDRLDIDNGKSLWKGGAAFLDTDRLKLCDADADNDRVYLPVGNALVAIDLKSGKTAWEAELPELRGVPGWIVRTGQKCVIAYPRAAIPREPLVQIGSRMLRTLRNEPAMWRLPGLAFGLYDAWMARAFPILMFDLETGRLLGKIEIPATGPTVSVCFDHDRAVIATGDRVCWLK